MYWSGVGYCDVFISCLDSHSDGTHSLQRIHWWASDIKLRVIHFHFWVNYSFDKTHLYPHLVLYYDGKHWYSSISNINVLCAEGGVTNILTTELFTQTDRPAAYMIGGSINWISFFFIGMIFPFIVVWAPSFLLLTYGYAVFYYSEFHKAVVFLQDTIPYLLCRFCKINQMMIFVKVLFDESY